ncbi:MAG: WGxxGxxG family protein [Stenomitos frigidus ULC029]
MTFNPSKTLWAGACALSLAVLPLALPASAQTGTDTAPGATSNQQVESAREDDGFDWGWLGLLGLIGLAGLTRKNEQTQTYREPNEASRSSSRL